MSNKIINSNIILKCWSKATGFIVETYLVSGLETNQSCTFTSSCLCRACCGFIKVLLVRTTRGPKVRARGVGANGLAYSTCGLDVFVCMYYIIFGIIALQNLCYAAEFVSDRRTVMQMCIIRLPQSI